MKEKERTENVLFELIRRDKIIKLSGIKGKICRVDEVDVKNDQYGIFTHSYKKKKKHCLVHSSEITLPRE